MKKVNISNEINQMTFSAKFDNEEKMNSWIAEQIASNSWGKAERISSNDENHPERVLQSRLLEKKEETDPDMFEYTIKADYVITIVNLEQDYDYLLEQCYNNRKLAYGSWESQLDEIYHNGLDSWKARIEQVKIQFPLPIKG